MIIAIQPGGSFTAPSGARSLRGIFEKGRIPKEGVMTTDHYDPHEQALLDYFNGDTSAAIVIHESGKQKEVPLSLFFRGWDEFPHTRKEGH